MKKAPLSWRPRIYLLLLFAGAQWVSACGKFGVIPATVYTPRQGWTVVWMVALSFIPFVALLVDALCRGAIRWDMWIVPTAGYSAFIGWVCLHGPTWQHLTALGLFIVGFIWVIITGVRLDHAAERAPTPGPQPIG